MEAVRSSPGAADRRGTDTGYCTNPECSRYGAPVPVTTRWEHGWTSWAPEDCAVCHRPLDEQPSGPAAPEEPEEPTAR